MFYKKDKSRSLSDEVVSNPEELPGVKKKSFALPFSGGEIWFEHLDGMYQYTELVLHKLREDSKVFLLPSRPGVIGFVMDETVINQTVVDEIAKVLCQGGKRFMRVAFIGTNREIKKFLEQALGRETDFAVGFFEDMEVAKVWLVS